MKIIKEKRGGLTLKTVVIIILTLVLIAIAFGPPLLKILRMARG